MLNEFLADLGKMDLRLSEGVAERELRFLDELLRWNRQVNLTAIRDRSEALEKHLVDSLFLLNHLPQSGRLLDMGSGGGLPGIPLAIALSDLQVVSVDSVGKKINFQKHIKRLLSLDNLLPIHSRLESVNKNELFDFVVARALSDFSTLVELSAPLLREGGKLLVMKGPEGEDELASFQALGGDDLYRVTDIHRYQLPSSRSERQLILLTRKSH